MTLTTSLPELAPEFGSRAVPFNIQPSCLTDKSDLPSEIVDRGHEKHWKCLYEKLLLVKG